MKPSATSPTVPKKKHTPCGVFGQILQTIVSVAVTILTGGNAVLGDIAGQLFGLAIGNQKSFNWKELAQTAIAQLVGGPSSGAGFLEAIAEAVAANVITQGISIAVGLQKKFDWTAVAVAGVSAGVGQQVGKWAQTAGYNTTTQRIFSTTARDIAGAATRTLVDGSDFGDNLIASLPDALGSVAGNYAAERFGVWDLGTPTLMGALEDQFGLGDGPAQASGSTAPANPHPASARVMLGPFEWAIGAPNWAVKTFGPQPEPPQVMDQSVTHRIETVVVTGAKVDDSDAPGSYTFPSGTGAYVPPPPTVYERITSSMHNRFASWGQGSVDVLKWTYHNPGTATYNVFKGGLDYAQSVTSPLGMVETQADAAVGTFNLIGTHVDAVANGTLPEQLGQDGADLVVVGGATLLTRGAALRAMALAPEVLAASRSLIDRALALLPRTELAMPGPLTAEQIGSPFFVRIDPITGKGPMAIDTAGFSGPSTLDGGVRNPRQFWKQWADRYPGTLSDANMARIKIGQSPVVDDIWARNFPEHGDYAGETIVHHHLDYGVNAIPLPGTLHSQQPGWGIWHSNHAGN